MKGMVNMNTRTNSKKIRTLIIMLLVMLTVMATLTAVVFADGETSAPEAADSVEAAADTESTEAEAGDEAPQSRFYSTLWALLPPVIAIGLALITKEVYSSLFAGIVVGALHERKLPSS